MILPGPRRGLLLIDPSCEIKFDFTEMPRLLANFNRKWPVGELPVWHQILISGAHSPLNDALKAMAGGKARYHEDRFPPPGTGHGMTGSGLCAGNPP